MLHRPPIWSSKQNKTLHASFLPIFLKPKSVWIYFLVKQSVHLIRQEIESPHNRERARRGLSVWRNDAAHLSCFGGETVVLLFAFERVPVKSCVLHCCLLSLECNGTTHPFPPSPTHPNTHTPSASGRSSDPLHLWIVNPL